MRDKRSLTPVPSGGGESGQVHFLFIFGALALACVAFLVFNTGELSARRIRLQNGADAAAHAAATWTARGMNIISANNVTMTQLISMIVLIDSLDVYCDLATPIARVQREACERFKWTNWPPLVFEGYRWSHRAIREEAFLELLGEIVDEMLATFHPTEPDAADSLWQVMFMLEEFSDSVVEVTPVMTAERAVTLGRAHGATRAFAWPYWTPVPVTKADWQTFKLPTERGSRCPGPIKPQFGYQLIYGGIYQHDQDDEDIWHAWNIGPLNHLRRAVNHMLSNAGGHYPHHNSENATTNFISFTKISNAKFNLLFSGRREVAFQYEEQFAQFPPPQQAQNTVWCDEDMHCLDPKPNLIIQPRDYPDYVNGPPAPPIQTRWHLVKPTYNRRKSQGRDWRPDAPFAPVPGAQATWEAYFPFESTLYPEFNIGEVRPGGGRTPATEPTTVYHHQRYVYRYSKRTETMDFPNPAYGRNELPRPYVLNSSWDNMTEGRMKEEWSWLGFAWRSGRAQVWPRYFPNSVPGGQMIAVARARLYNRTSWDMFTQDWRVLMLPVGRMDAWLNGTAGTPDQGLLGGLLSAEDVEPVRLFFRAVPPDLHDALITH